MPNIFVSEKGGAEVGSLAVFLGRFSGPQLIAGRRRFGFLLVFLAALVFAADSFAAGACSPAMGKVTLNEYNHLDDFAEISRLDTSVSIIGWEIRVYSSSGSYSSRSLPASGGNVCGTSPEYQVANYASNETPTAVDVVLLDANGDVVDIMRGRSALPVTTSFYAKPACSYVGPSTDLIISSAQKGVDRSPDSVGPWRNTPGTGAGSFTTKCGGNTPTSSNNADLAVSKTISTGTVSNGASATVAPGEVFTFSVTALNNGPNTANVVTVRDTWPAGLVYETPAPAASQGSYDQVNGVWSVGTLSSGASASLTIKASASAIGTYPNTVVVSSDNTDATTSNNSSTATASTVSSLHHYAISYPSGSTGVTCEALAVTVTGHDSADAATAPPAGTQITLSTSPATGGWALKSGQGSFTAPDKYTFSGVESAVDFWLTQTTPSANIDLDVTDGSKTDKDGDASEDAKASFADTAFKYYACSGAVPGTCSEVAINTQVAGIDSNAAPAAQNLYLRAVKTATTNGACIGGLAGAQNVEWGYECNAPASCAGSNLLSVNGGVATTVERNNATTISSTTGIYTPGVAMTFDANGFAPFNLRYSDVGKITLHARKTLAAGVGTPPSTAALLYGASNALVVKPYGFKLSGISCGNNFSSHASAFCPAGETFAGMVSAVRYDGAAANNLGAATPSFGQEGQTVSFLPNLVSPVGGAAGTVMSVLGPWSAGDAAIALNWSEVGEIRLTPTIDYFALGDLTSGGKADSENFFGQRRFYPYRMLLADNGSAEACAAGDLTYAGQPFSLGFTLTAIRKDGNAVRNYGLTTSLKTTGAAISLAAENADSGNNLGANINTDPAGAVPAFTLTWPSGVPADAVATVAATSYRYHRPAAPFAALDSMRIGFLFQDDSGDSVPLVAGDFNPATTGACLPASCNAKTMVDTRLRYGRARIDNAFGSAILPLKVNVRTEYYKDATDQWRSNTPDVCSKLVTVPASASNGGLVFFAQTTSNQLAAGEVLAEIAGSTAIAPINMPFVAGVSSILLRSPASATTGPGVANFGYVELDFLASGFAWPSWLPPASPTGRARASFGLYKGSDRLIYRREVR